MLKTEIMFTLWLFLATLLVSPESSGASPSDILQLEPTADRASVDKNSRAASLRFIPEYRLSEYEGDRTRSAGQETLRDQLAASASVGNVCQRPMEGDVPRNTSAPTSPDAGATAIFQNNPVLLIGAVESIAAGWDIPRSQAATLVTVSVREVVKDLEGKFHPGDRFTYLQETGSFVHGGSRFCTLDPSSTAVSIEDQLAVAGDYDLGNPMNLAVTNAGVFFVRGDTVVSARKWGEDHRPVAVALDQMRRRANPTRDPKL